MILQAIFGILFACFIPSQKKVTTLLKNHNEIATLLSKCEGNCANCHYVV